MKKITLQPLSIKILDKLKDPEYRKKLKKFQRVIFLNASSKDLKRHYEKLKNNYKFIPDKEIYKLIGKNLKSLRTLYNLTLNELSKITGFSVNYIGNIERGERKPALQTLQLLAHIFNININDFFSFKKTYLSKKQILINKILFYLKNKKIKDIKKIIKFISEF